MGLAWPLGGLGCRDYSRTLADSSLRSTSRHQPKPAVAIGDFPHVTDRREALWAIGLDVQRTKGMSIFVLLRYAGYAVGNVAIRFFSSTEAL